ncbi:hypothetical protein ISS03_01565 [Patescibacteria group bacterium]|nr:hypothetical protein [Patescibacteria group bacterium]
MKNQFTPKFNQEIQSNKENAQEDKQAETLDRRGEIVAGRIGKRKKIAQAVDSIAKEEIVDYYADEKGINKEIVKSNYEQAVEMLTLSERIKSG